MKLYKIEYSEYDRMDEVWYAEERIFDNEKDALKLWVLIKTDESKNLISFDIIKVKTLKSESYDLR